MSKSIRIALALSLASGFWLAQMGAWASDGQHYSTTSTSAFAPPVAPAIAQVGKASAPKAKSTGKRSQSVKDQPRQKFPDATEAFSSADQRDDPDSGSPTSDAQFGEIKPFSQSAVSEPQNSKPDSGSSDMRAAQEQNNYPGQISPGQGFGFVPAYSPAYSPTGSQVFSPQASPPAFPQASPVWSQQTPVFPQNSPQFSAPPGAPPNSRLPRAEWNQSQPNQISPGTVPSQKQVNDRIVDFVRKNMGRQVGDGECWSLAAAAMEAAGAVPPDDYNFGRELAANEEWLPGDIIQFTSCVFKQTLPGGGWEVFEAGVPNHTAVCLGKKEGKVLVGQQNMAGDKTVSTMLLDFNCLVSGSYKVYRTVPQR